MSLSLDDNKDFQSCHPLGSCWCVRCVKEQVGIRNFNRFHCYCAVSRRRRQIIGFEFMSLRRKCSLLICKCSRPLVWPSTLCYRILLANWKPPTMGVQDASGSGKENPDPIEPMLPYNFRQGILGVESVGVGLVGQEGPRAATILKEKGSTLQGDIIYC